MGVAVHHEKIVAKHESWFDSYYHVDDLIEDGLELVKQNEHLAHEILTPDKYFRILTFESERGKLKHLNSGYSRKDDVILIGKPSELADEIKLLEEQHHLDVANCLAAQFLEEEHSSQRSYPLSYRKELILYYNQVGYCKSCMGGGFYDEFPQMKFYFKKENVLKARTYLNVNFEENVEIFQRDFIDSFEEGKSIFFQY